MIKKIAIGLTAIALLTMISVSSANAQSRTVVKNDFGIELLGKAVLYSFNYQYMVTPRIGLQAGLGALGGGDNEGTATVMFVPMGARYYLIQKDGSPFVTAGIVYLSARSDSGPINSATYSYAGLGFEFRSQGGFLFRGTAYTLISDGSFFIWPGLNLGYAF